MLGMKKFYNVKSNSKTSLNGSSSNIFDKLSRRYSVIGQKILRKSPGPKTNRKVVSGSYNMTGSASDDLRPEIGAPILISKIDRTDLDTIDRRQSPQSPTFSIDSDADVFLDAKSSFADIKFQFLPEGTSSPNSSFEGSYDVTDKLPESRSAMNLHRTELNVYLQKTSSLETVDDGDANHQCYDFPKPKPPVPEFEPELKPTNLNQKETTDSLIERRDSIISGSSASYNCYTVQPVSLSISTEKIVHNLSMDNDSVVNNVLNEGDQCSNCVDNRPLSVSQESIETNSSINPEDYDFKSVSVESLNAKNVFLSIDELNELTRQINESEVFVGTETIDFEYVDHRDNLKPSERRITLLRNKDTNRFIHISADKRERLAKKWSSIKHWVGEEKVKLKDVVHRHAALQRVGRRSSEKCDDDTTDSPSRGESLERGDDHPSSSTQNREITSEDRETLPAEIGSRKSSIHKTPEKFHDEGQNGFEELRRYVKQGGDFGKELAAILHERMEAEQNYSKSLSKMAQKLNKASRDIPGSIAEAWRSVSTEMESRSEVHRQFSMSLADEIVKPLKTILDNQHKSRKAIEGNVDKASRLLSEWRTAELKGKKSSHTAARENEKLQDALLDVRVQRSPSLAIVPPGIRNSLEKESKEKDYSKLENKRKKAEDAVKRNDVEYYQLCIRAERARVDWEIAVLRGSSMLQSLENQRLSHFKEYVKSYHKLSNEMNPVIETIVQRLEPQILACNVQKDLAVVKNIRRAAEGPSEQLLPDFYCEHTTLAMNRERRKQSLVKLLQLIKQDLERERKSRSGLKGFSQTINNQDNQNITDKLYHIRSMLTYLEGARYKLQSALLELDHRPRGSHPLAQHIQVTRDRSGLQQSILKVPLWLKNDENDNSSQNIAADDFEVDTYASSGAEETPKPIVIKCENKLLVQKINARNKLRDSPSFTNGTNGETNGDKEGSPSEQDKLANGSFCDRGVADGNSNQPESDFDEFSSDEEASKSEASKLTTESTKQPLTVLGKCKALYSYTPKLYDELELFPGDIIEVHHKQEDGWWMGSLRNNVGIFPATYVEEVD